MAGTTRIECCADRGALEEVIASAAAVVQLRALPVPSMFPPDLRDAAAQVPYEVVCAVAPPQVAAQVGVRRPRLGQALVFSNRLLLGRVEATAEDRVRAVVGLFRAGLSPWLGQDNTPQWEDDEAEEEDPFTVIGVAPGASFEDVRAAWRARLAEYHPDRFQTAGDKIRRLAVTETQRINAAFETIARAHLPKR